MKNKEREPEREKQPEAGKKSYSSKTSKENRKFSGKKTEKEKKPYRRAESSDYRKEESFKSGKERPSGSARRSNSDSFKEKKHAEERKRPYKRIEEKPPYKRSGASDSERYSEQGSYQKHYHGSDKRRSFSRDDEADNERNIRSRKKYSGDRDTESGGHSGSGFYKEKRYGAERTGSPKRTGEKPPYKRSGASDSGKYRDQDSNQKHYHGSERKRSFYMDEDLGYDRNKGRRTGYGEEKPAEKTPRPVKADPTTPIRLNKFIANAGVCSRREADKYIESGAVKVNGVIVTELGTKVSPTDKVQLGDQTLSSEKHRYVLLNKPKGYITTSDDPFKRNTVMALVENACRERIYPVGRLDRNTTGLLLFTNDGELTKRLTHPRFGVRKVYDVELDKPLIKKDMEAIAGGVELEEDIISIDDIAYVDYDKSRKHIGIILHSGQNRVVRRIFEKFGYEVTKLDRVMIGSLTKKDLPRGKWRHLNDSEIRMLKRL
ncbi:MAG: pseudouridine synthase [Bacteroidales bacterium]